jgi:hypothetical protein
LVEFVQKLLISLHPMPSLEDLSLLFEQEGVHLPFGQAAAQIVKRAVFFALFAAAVRASTLEKALQEGGVQRIGRQGQGAQETSFALAQGEGGEASEFYLTHIMSKIENPVGYASKNEKARSKRKRFRRA